MPHGRDGGGEYEMEEGVSRQPLLNLLGYMDMRFALSGFTWNGPPASASYTSTLSAITIPSPELMAFDHLVLVRQITTVFLPGPRRQRTNILVKIPVLLRISVSVFACLLWGGAIGQGAIVRFYCLGQISPHYSLKDEK